MMRGSHRWWRELGLEPPPGSSDGSAAVRPAATGHAPGRSADAPAPRLEQAQTPARPPAGRSRPGTAPPPVRASGAPPASAATAPPATAPDPVRTANIAGLGWEELPAAIEACMACGLRAGRKRSVPGVGDRHARWLFVGEGPGAEEDQRGEPFVGAAGQLLDSMLAALDLHRGKDVFIANVVKCRPPANRTPEVLECAQCLPFLERQIALIRPSLIVALGRVAAQSLLATQMNVGSLRGKVHQHEGIPLIVTYHPAYLLRNQPEKARAWVDLCLARRTLTSTV